MKMIQITIYHIQDGLQNLANMKSKSKNNLNPPWSGFKLFIQERGGKFWITPVLVIEIQRFR